MAKKSPHVTAAPVFAANTVTLNEALETILAAPALTYTLTGSPGVGKTFKTRAQLQNAGYHVTLVACQNMPVEDTAALPIRQDDGTIKFAPNELWRPIPGRKQAFILDELPKTPDEAVFNAFNGMLHGHPRTMQGFEYPDDTIVVVTTNPAQFGAGDLIRPHHINRMVMLNIADPTVTEATTDMLDLGFHGSIISWVEKTPQALVSYDHAMQDKPIGETTGYFGYLTSLPGRSFCSMRSLHGASRVLQSGMSKERARGAICGLIGFDAMSSLMMHVSELGDVVDMKEIEAAPEQAHVPPKLFDQRHQALICAAALTMENADAVFTYAERFKPDVFRGVFLANVVRKRVWTTGLVVRPRFSSVYRAAFAS